LLLYSVLPVMPCFENRLIKGRQELCNTFHTWGVNDARHVCKLISCQVGSISILRANGEPCVSVDP
jgi:hypothetical protein